MFDSLIHFGGGHFAIPGITALFMKGSPEVAEMHRKLNLDDPEKEVDGSPVTDPYTFKDYLQAQKKAGESMMAAVFIR
eukprot:scaffold22758_cov206-Cylindrotheca_fusiformis.AAC.2